MSGKRSKSVHRPRPSRRSVGIIKERRSILSPPESFCSRRHNFQSLRVTKVRSPGLRQLIKGMIYSNTSYHEATMYVQNLSILIILIILYHWSRSRQIKIHQHQQIVAQRQRGITCLQHFRHELSSFENLVAYNTIQAPDSIGDQPETEHHIVQEPD